MKKYRSKKHHYLPRYYLKGFTDNRNRFFVYDKQRDIIFPNAFIPGNFFFENNLNTVTLPSGILSDFMESFYASIENKFWNSLDTIRNSNRKTTIPIFDLMHLFFFLLFLHWRLPSNIKYVEELSGRFFDTHFKELNYINIKDKNSNTAPLEIINKIKESAAFKKSSKLVIPFAPFYKSNWSEKLKNWRFLYTGDGDIWNLVGDNPIITIGNKDHDPICCLDEFIFPISGKILLVNINKHLDKDFSPEFTIQFNTAIIQRAQRFVAFKNKSFLEAIVKDYRIHVDFNKTDIIIPELFSMLEK